MFKKISEEGLKKIDAAQKAAYNTYESLFDELDKRAKALEEKANEEAKKGDDNTSVKNTDAANNQVVAANKMGEAAAAMSKAATEMNKATKNFGPSVVAGIVARLPKSPTQNSTQPAPKSLDPGLVPA